MLRWLIVDLQLETFNTSAILVKISRLVGAVVVCNNVSLVV